MRKYMTMKNPCLNTLGALMLLLMVGAFSAPADAQGSPVQGSTVTAAPVQLAWWHGPGYYHRGYWGGPRSYVCPRTCWRGRWGYVHCTRRCY